MTNCGCTDKHRCKEAERLWRIKTQAWNYYKSLGAEGWADYIEAHNAYSRHITEATGKNELPNQR